MQYLVTYTEGRSLERLTIVDHPGLLLLATDPRTRIIRVNELGREILLVPVPLVTGPSEPSSSPAVALR